MRKKFYWCLVAPIFSPAGEKIEQVKVEQEIRRAHIDGDKRDAFTLKKALPD